MPDEHACQARTTVDRARVGMLTTYARHPSGQHRTSVGLHARADGSVELHLALAAVAVRQLLARPVATLQVAPLWCEPVRLHGAARRLPGLSDRGDLVFHLQVTAVRVGSPPVLLDEAAYAAAAPDPLRHEAPDVLRHLNEGHADALATCLRAGGHDVGFASATRLDTAGLTAVAVGRDGVDTVRLSFPRPITDLGDLPPSLRHVLSPGCGCCSTARPGRAPGPGGG